MTKSLPETYHKLLSVSTAAKFLGVSAMTLRRWDKDNKLKSHRTVGGSRRYSLGELEEFKHKLKESTQEKEEISISEAAELLGVTTKTIRNWEKIGKLSSVRTAQNYRIFRKIDIEKLSETETKLEPSIEPAVFDLADIVPTPKQSRIIRHLLILEKLLLKHTKFVHFQVKKTHLLLGVRFAWYSRWHRFKFHPHVHWFALSTYIVGVFSGILFVLAGGLNFPIFAAGELTDTWDFSVPGNYSLSDSNLIEVAGNNARLKTQNYSADANTQLLLHLDESSGNPSDSSSYANSATNNNGTYAAGNLNNAITLNGTSAYISIASSASLNLSGSNTIEAWTKFTSSFSSTSHSQKQGVVDKGAYKLYYDNDSGKVVYEIASSNPSWNQAGGPNIDAGNGSSVNGSWDLNSKPIITNQVEMGGNIYVGLGNGTSDAEVWRCSSCTTSPSWTQVGGDGLYSSWADGTYEEVTSLATDGTTLYVGIGLTANDAEVWRCSSCGGTPNWGGARIAGKGTNSTWNTSYETVSSMVVSGTTLVVGIGNNAANEAEVWRCTSCDGGSLSWSKIGGDGVNSSWNTSYENVPSMVLMGTNVVVGLGSSAGDGEVWRCTTNCLSGTPTWGKIGGDGTGAGGQSWGSTYEQIISMTYSGNVLYVGTGTTPANEADVWRCGDVTTCNVTSGWTQVGGDGLNSSWTASTYETVRSLLANGSTVYAGIGDSSGEAEVWRCTTCDGTPAWSKIGEGGTGTPPQSWTTPFTYAQTLLLSGTTLFVGVSNSASSSSAELWSCDIGGTCNATTGWSRVAGDYLNKSWGMYNLQSVESMTTGNGYLYAGTGITVAGNALVWQYDGSAWTMIGGQGINSSWAFRTYEVVTSLQWFSGKLYAGLGSTAGDAEVWEWNGSAWTQIGGTASGNWGTASYETVPTMAVWNGKLYAGLGNNAANEAEVWEWSSGTTWTKIGGDGVGSPASWNTSYETVNSLGVYNGNLVAGIGASASDAEVWSYNGTGWTKFGGDGSGSGGQSWGAGYEQIDSMNTYGGDFYVGLGTTAGDSEVWKCTGSCTVTTGWTMVGGDAVNSSWADVTYERIYTMQVYNGKLYVGLGLTAAEGEVWEWDGSTWTKVGGDGSGWTTGNNIENVSAMAIFKGKMYVGLGNTANADSMIWAYGSNGYLESAATSQNTSWHHIAATYDGTTMKVFVDGVENSSTTASGITIPTISIPLLVGTNYGESKSGRGQGYFAGSIDEVRISNTARGSFQTTPYSSAPQTVRPTAAVRTYGAAAWDNFVPTEIPGGGTITYRLSSDGGTTWKYYNSGWVTSNSISEANSAAVIDTNVPTFPVTNGGLLWQAILDGDGTQQVTVDQVFIDATHDITAPATNASALAMNRYNGGPSVSSGGWTNNLAPYFSWTAGSDLQSGIRGYCLYLGTTVGGDPATSSGLISTTSPISTAGTTCQFIIGSNNIDFATTAYRGSTWLTSSTSTYYFNVKAVDIAGNLYPTSASFNFRFDNTLPTNPAFVSPPGGFVATYDVTTTWPTSGGSAPADSHSGLAGLQYKISSTGKWYGDTHNGAEDATDLLANDGSYTTQTDPDHGGSLTTDDLVEGVNNIYFRTWDAAGNVTTAFVSGEIKINTSSPSAPQSLVAIPTTNTVNSFAFDWDPPVTYQGSASNITYCYTVNTLPSAGTCTFTAAGVTQLSAGAYANQPGSNTMYVVAKDEAGNINYATYSSVSFTANTGSPGVPLNPDIADISVKATSNWRLAITWEPPTVVGAGVASYKIDRSTDDVSYAQVASTSGTSYVDTGLSQVRYYYKVKACDSANSCGALTSQVNEIPTGKFTEPATLTVEPKTTSVGTKTVTISWATDRGSDSRIAFGTSSGNYFGAEVSNSSQVTDHNITINNLTAGTTYYYKAKWVDEDGNQGQSSEKTFTTLPPPTISEVETRNINLTAATIKFTTKDATKINILFGKSTEFGGLKSIPTSTTESTQTAELTGLDDGTKYYFKLNSFDTEDNEYTGNVFSFSTLPRPLISNLKFDGVAGEPTSTMRVTWTTNVPTSSTVNYTPDEGIEVQNFNAELKTEHEVILRELADDTQYTINVSGRDSLGNLVTSDSNTFRTALDTRAPKISELTIETAIQGSGNDSKAQLIISWVTDEPSTSQIEFGEGTGGSYTSKTVEDNKLVTDHIVIISELSPSKTYHLRSVSRDKANNAGTSEDNTAITGRASENILEIILNAIRNSLGFLGNPLQGFQ